jgi:hypothetical protein
MYLIEEYYQSLPLSAYSFIFYILGKNKSDAIEKHLLRYNLQLSYIWIWAYYKIYI